MPSWKWIPTTTNLHEKISKFQWKKVSLRGVHSRSLSLQNSILTELEPNYCSKMSNFGLKIRVSNRPKNKNVSNFQEIRVSKRGTHRRSFSLQNSILTKLEPNYFSKIQNLIPVSGFQISPKKSKFLILKNVKSKNVGNLRRVLKFWWFFWKKIVKKEKSVDGVSGPRTQYWRSYSHFKISPISNHYFWDQFSWKTC